MARSLDRLLTYAEGRQLSEDQLRALQLEMDEAGGAAAVLHEFREGLQRAIERVRAIAPESFAEPRGVGRKMLPTTVAGLLIHCAEHTQRHSGQMVTTVKVVRG
ncbi:DinB family protein [Granulicella sp. 5B5]|uniref:DinB family protein n=1 Tax=Granulicella sp. 5B5 TaxID=1617967 RepID=UPI0031FC7BB8